MKTWYDVLGVHPSITADDLRVVYLRKARELHPDKGGSVRDFQILQEVTPFVADYDCNHSRSSHAPHLQ